MELLCTNGEYMTTEIRVHSVIPYKALGSLGAVFLMEYWCSCRRSTILFAVVLEVVQCPSQHERAQEHVSSLCQTAYTPNIELFLTGP